jgi:hypothetical protein
MNTEVIGTSKLSRLTRKELIKLDSVIQVEGFDGEFLAVLLPYKYFLELQDRIIKADGLIDTLEQKLGDLNA